MVEETTCNLVNWIFIFEIIMMARFSSRIRNWLTFVWWCVSLGSVFCLSAGEYACVERSNSLGGKNPKNRKKIWSVLYFLFWSHIFKIPFGVSFWKVFFHIFTCVLTGLTHSLTGQFLKKRLHNMSDLYPKIDFSL